VRIAGLGHIFLTVAAVVIGTIVLSAQSPIPLRGGGAGGRQGGQGPGGAPEPSLPASPTAVALPTISAPIGGPGPMFESLMELKPGDDMAHFRYEATEYFVSGTANGQPYTTRIVIRKPVDEKRFSGLVLAESMHPSGNAWMFHFTHRYSMSEGHIGLDVLTSTHEPFVEFNGPRYTSLRVAPGQAPDILAQVGALIKSKSGPLASYPIRKMILAGTSASAAVVINYLPAHTVLRLADMGPIYDGFMPTSTGATIAPQFTVGGTARPIDVPIVQVPTMTEVASANVTARQDSDMPGNQFRVYEFPGMAHIDSRDAAAYYPNPCKLPISRFPMAAYMSVALDHLWKWVDKATAPPRADRILVDRNEANDGSLMALDENGNPRGGIRNPYVDVPVKAFAVRNTGAVPPIANAHPFVASRTPQAQAQLCGLAGYEVALTPERLKKLYKDTKSYRAAVAKRLDELTKQGWSLPVYRDVILADAAGVSF
jgi:alpha/beta hydrolase family protein